MHQPQLLGVLILVTTLLAPAALGIVGWLASRHAASIPGRGSGLSPGLTINSVLLHALAFNLVFFWQELFLVLPKALTPGLEPVLFHNNHTWAGSHPLENLFQGTGMFAILLLGLAFLLVARRTRNTGLWRLFAIWMACNGLLQALAQIPSGVFAPASDVGRAMQYLGLSDPTKNVVAIAALGALAAVPLLLLRPLLELARTQQDVASAGARTRFVLFAAVLPLVLGVLLIVPFRLPAPLPAVLMPPLVVAVLGATWISAGAWRVALVEAAGTEAAHAFSPGLVATLIALLAFFHFVLRPGIAF